MKLLCTECQEKVAIMYMRQLSSFPTTFPDFCNACHSKMFKHVKYISIRENAKCVFVDDPNCY